MKAILSNYRYYVLSVLAIIAILGIMAVPAEDLPLGAWHYMLISSKVIGFLAGYIADQLIKRWEKRKTIPELIHFVENY